ncbi:excinuclease ABC subunit UvrB [Lentisphaerota bacterium ZTH]|nr:excinuclease ABC subunit UvrB [Lentisphaerota bacterium]WET07224.1 excinuclease ABC subunit UvrB [Lentisphaerota bacterium ZTH]
MSLFKLVSKFKPSGDQPEAIQALLEGFSKGRSCQTLLGVTGSGKTFTLANTIAQLDRPVLVLSHNKTLAAQLYSEFKSFFPDNAVEYFISYYDYYLPESYIPQTDTYIAKDASINENIEKLRLSATTSLLERKDVIVVASVSCIYGLGSPEDYEHMCVPVKVGDNIGRDALLRGLVNIQYERNDTAPEKGQFRVRGDTVDVFEPQREEFVRVEFWGDEVEAISRHIVVSGKIKNRTDKVMFFPCKHFVMPPERIEAAVTGITEEMKKQVEYFESKGLLVEAQRIYQRVNYDLEMIREIGYCSGIENYSMYLSNRQPGSRPFCLFDFFPDNMITVIDESHATLPQLRAMYRADRSRKQTLVEHGFRLPSALENRPLKFDEFENLHNDCIFVSATPGDYEIEHGGAPIEQVIRPTGLLDPVVEIRPLEGQVDDVIHEIREASKRHERVLVTTLTKKSSERLSDYLCDLGIRCSYLHSELDALERVRVLSQLREGRYECVIGINLLREGIDLPEVALVAILDADKEGFLRSERSLFQVSGRAARNQAGKVILYADNVTPSIRKLVDTTKERRKKQKAYNKTHNITPKTIEKPRSITINDAVAMESGVKYSTADAVSTVFEVNESNVDFGSNQVKNLKPNELQELIRELEEEMMNAAESLEFERAADLRDRIKMISSDRFVK